MSQICKLPIVEDCIFDSISLTTLSGLALLITKITLIYTIKILGLEADLLNTIVFGCTAKDWRTQNTAKPTNHNIRDYASVLDLIILNNLEFLDAMLIQWNCDKEERKGILQDAYNFQYPLLKRSATIEKLQDLAAKASK